MGEVLMKHMDSDQKYVIAWFKIAEYVNRGEKERALGVYRLLSHSIDDQSLVLQLEADILYACQDERCFDIYYKAALDYLKKEKKGQAAALFEQMLLVKPDAMAIRSQLVTLYIKLEKNQAAYLHTKMLVCSYMDQKSLLLAYESAANFIVFFDIEQKIEIYNLFLSYQGDSDAITDKLKEWAVVALCEIAIEKGSLALEQFIIRVNEQFPAYAFLVKKHIGQSQ
jgi:tetratricopeptide (TPR) repeat protein